MFLFQPQRNAEMDIVSSVLRVDGLAYRGSGPMNNPPDDKYEMQPNEVHAQSAAREPNCRQGRLQRTGFWGWII